MRKQILDALSRLQVAEVQSLPSDDQIIMGHVRGAIATLKEALESKECQEVPFDVALFALILDYDLSGEEAARIMREVADGISGAARMAESERARVAEQSSREAEEERRTA